MSFAVLIVCTGICRSAAVEHLLRDALVADVRVRSTATGAKHDWWTTEAM